MKHLLLACMIALSGAGAHAAANGLPEAGFKAEIEGRWEKAAAIYHEALRGNPQQVELWLRVADIHARLKQYDQAAAALDQAAGMRTSDAALWKKLSEARAMANDKNGAFIAARRAVELEPANLDYLRAQAQLAVWATDDEAAAASYRKILKLAPEDAKARLWLARLNSWNGHTDDAVKNYQQYLQGYPDDKEARLELVKVEGWRGNFPDALDELEKYRARFGEDRGYMEQRARALAWLGKSTAALEIVEPLLKDAPRDPELLATRLIALNQSNRIDDALADLKAIESIRPGSKETRSLRRYLLTPLRSFVAFGLNYSRDSDDLRILRMTLNGEQMINPRTRLVAGVEGYGLDVRRGTGLENINGADNADYRRVWIGAKHRFSPRVAGDVRIGGANADHRHHLTEYLAALDLRLSDEWTVRPEIEHDLYAVSPRTVSLPVERNAVRLQARWTPGNRYVMDAVVRHDDYSDGNRRWDLSLAPRRELLRTESLNMDLGVSGTWHGFAHDLSNGYYDPRHYQRYALTSFMYWKLSEDDGLSLALSMGGHKDNAMPQFKFGGDAVAEGFFGIYSDWYLRVYGSVMHNVAASTGAYRSKAVGFSLIRRY